ncbi:hypothetical protein CDAR_551661 [Caerostris darwini]|uniref:Uncharacterized protein n=1 Tax=Caerostris darwini TaxID=1538125 RepID=A0AAV4V6K0_9ARAC|nr:hypothetical protein CDAR_551661 [Caerostris darwini]
MNRIPGQQHLAKLKEGDWRTPLLVGQNSLVQLTQRAADAALGTIKGGRLENPFIGGTKLPRPTHSESSSESPSIVFQGVKGARVDLSSKLAFRSAEIVETEEWRWRRICRQGRWEWRLE